MVINSIEQDGKLKFFFSIGGERVFFMTSSELKEFNLYSLVLAVLDGDDYKDNLSLEIADETIQTIREKIILPRGKKCALDLLADRDYTHSTLMNKLKDRGYNDEDCSEIMEYVDSFNYVDDVRYSVSYIRLKESIKSSRYIKSQLMLKGVSADDINKAFEIVEEEHLRDGVTSTEVTDAAIRRAIEKKISPADYQNRDLLTKVIASLVRKGYEYSDIRRVIDSLK